MIGRTLGGYQIIEQIGMGGMATVYKAYDASTDRYVALKTLPQQYSQDPTFVERFRREARAIAKLEHLHILPVHAYGEDDGIAYLVMRYLPAGTLTSRIRQSGRIPLDEAARLIAQIGSALDHAHSNGVLHRDVKPGNVLIDNDGNTFLTDFGIARMVEGTLDLTGDSILGTPQYMSPEQCQGRKDLTPASDQYALGVVLYEMITGRTPFQAETPLAVIHMQMMGSPLPPPTSLVPNLPEDVERVILKALARDPQDRFPSCSALAAAFEQAIHSAPTRPGMHPEDPPTVKVDASIPAPMMGSPTTHASQPTSARTPAPPRRSFLPFAIAGGVVAFIVLAVILSGALNNEDDGDVNALQTVSAFAAGSEAQASPTDTPTESPTDTRTESPIDVPAEAPTAVAMIDSDPAVQALVDEGNRALDNYDYEAAQAAFNNALAINPDSIPALFGRARTLYFDSGDYAAAVEALTRILELDPNNAAVLHQRGVIYRDWGEYDESLDDLSAALAVDDTVAAYYADRALTYGYSSQYENAVDDYAAAIALDGSNARYFMERGAYLSYIDRYDEAISDLDRSIELAPDSYEPYFSRGYIYLDMDRCDAAIPDFNRVIELRPEDIEAREGLVECALRVGDIDTALDYITQAIRLDEMRVHPYLTRGDIMMRLGDVGAAIDDYTRAIEIDPEYAEPYRRRARALDIAQRPEESLADYTRAIELDGGDGSDFAGRGNVYYFQLGDDDAAMEEYTAALDRDGGLSEAYLMRGTIYLEWEDYNSAISDFSAVIDMETDSTLLALAYLRRGEAYAGRGSTTLALDSFTAALEIDPENVAAYIGRGYLRMDREEDALAVADFTRAIELEPDNFAAYEGRAYAHASAGRNVLAVADMTRAIELDPQNDDLYIERGRMLMEGRLYDRARDDFAQAQEIAPYNPHVYLALGDMHYELRARVRALAAYRQYVELLGDETPEGYVLERIAELESR